MLQVPPGCCEFGYHRFWQVHLASLHAEFLERAYRASLNFEAPRLLSQSQPQPARVAALPGRVSQCDRTLLLEAALAVPRSVPLQQEALRLVVLLQSAGPLVQVVEPLFSPSSALALLSPDEWFRRPSQLFGNAVDHLGREV